MENLDRFDEYQPKIDFDFYQQFILTKKNNSSIRIIIFVDRNYKIIKIEGVNTKRLYFPFKEGIRLSLSKLSDWACENDFLVNGKNTCQEEKVFGIRASDVPQGHPLRFIYPNKFR